MAEHRPRPFWGAEGEICAACGDWWPCAQEEACVHDRARADDLECPECGADLAALD